jgi:glucokinase
MKREFLIGIDVGGSFTKVGVIKDRGVVYFRREATVVGSDQKAFFDFVFGMVDDAVKQSGASASQIGGIGVGVPGMVTGNSTLLSAVNLGLSGVNVAAVLEKKYGVPVKVGNDVAMFALAQAQHSNIDNLVYIALGTGINIGVVNNGRIFGGADSASLEYGHTCIMADPSQEKCTCGLAGCVEQFISGKAIMAHARKLGVTATTPEQAFEQHKEVADRFLLYLSTVLINITNTYRPQAIFYWRRACENG